MKKALSIFLVVVVVAVGYFTFFDNEDLKAENPILAKIEENPNMYPLYNRLDKDEKEAYIKIVTAFQNFDESISNVYKSDSKRGVENFIYSLECNVYREIAYEHPECFGTTHTTLNQPYQITAKMNIFYKLSQCIYLINNRSSK